MHTAAVALPGDAVRGHDLGVLVAVPGPGGGGRVDDVQHTVAEAGLADSNPGRGGCVAVVGLVGADWEYTATAGKRGSRDKKNISQLVVLLRLHHVGGRSCLDTIMRLGEH